MNPKWAIVLAEFVAGVAAHDQLPAPALGEVAFAGRSNVGKSSLLGVMLERKGLVRTGSTPGTTRQLNLFHVKANDGLELTLVDLPGYGFAKRAKHEKSRWGALIEGYLSKRVTLRAVVLLIDVRRGVEQEERDLVEFLKSVQPLANRPAVDVIAVVTKIDKLAGARRKPAVEKIGRELGCRVYGFSAETGDGKEELWGAIRARVVGSSPAGQEVPTQEREVE